MALPRGTTGSLSPAFTPARLDRSRSQALICLYAQHPIANRIESALELLRYSLGGIRPRQTTRLALSPAVLQRNGVRTQRRQGWYFTVDSTSAGTEASKSPTYGPTHVVPKLNTKAAVKVHGVFPSTCGQAASSPPVRVRRACPGDNAQVITLFMHVGTYPTRNFATLGPS